MLLVVCFYPFCAAKGWDDGGMVELLIKQHTIILPNPLLCGKGRKKINIVASEAIYKKGLDATRNGGLALPAYIHVCVFVSPVVSFRVLPSLFFF